MGAIDFVLNLAGLLLWLSWCALHFDRLVKFAPVTLAGTLKRAEPRRVKGWQLAVVLSSILALRAVLYWLIGAPADWTPKINLELVVLAFRGDVFAAVFVYSCLSFLRALVVFYFWLLVLSVINRGNKEVDPVEKAVRVHLGRVGRWPWPAQVLLPVLAAVLLWVAAHPLLVRLGVVAPVHSLAHLTEEGLLVGLGLFLSLKYVLPLFLLLYLVASYIYLGNNPFWDFVGRTSINMMGPLRRLPLRLAKLDLAPVFGVLLILCVLEWLPNFVLSRLAAANLTAWPL
jgi:uncharacterized protein YggT (Ycf19 family)